MVGSVDTAGNVAASLPIYVDLIDTLPPNTPTGLVGTIDTAGVVRLHWDLGPEDDLLGYRVLWANDSTHEFSQLTGNVLHDTLFVDTVKVATLTEHVYYKVAAVDTRFLHSEMTHPLELNRPDLLAPEAPLFTDVFVSDTTVQLSWAPSASKDVVKQVLMRRTSVEEPWKELTTLGAFENRYVDSDVEKRQRYFYRIIAVDDAGLRSIPAPDVAGRPYDRGKRSGVHDPKGTYNSKTGVITLTWNFSGLDEEYWFVIYRSYNGSRMKQYRAVGSSERKYADHLLVGNGTYDYTVRVMTPHGESDPSTKISVTVR